MMPLRQSIVNRRVRPSSARNVPNIDKEFEQQLITLKKQQEKFLWKEAEVRQAVSPQRPETLRRQEELRKSIDEQLKQKEAEREKLALDEKLACYDGHSASGPHSHEEDMGRIQHRRAYLKDIMDDNIRLAALKKESEKIQKQLEAELDLIRAKTPCTWNRRHYL